MTPRPTTGQNDTSQPSNSNNCQDENLDFQRNSSTHQEEDNVPTSNLESSAIDEDELSIRNESFELPIESYDSTIPTFVGSAIVVADDTEERSRQIFQRLMRELPIISDSAVVPISSTTNLEHQDRLDAEIENETANEDDKRKEFWPSVWKRRCTIAFFLFAVIGAIAAAISIPLATKRHQNENDSPKDVSTVAPSTTTMVVSTTTNTITTAATTTTGTSQTTNDTEEIKALKKIISFVSEESALADSNTPQYRALDWLATDSYLNFSHLNETISGEDEYTIISRYVLAVLYFSTGGGEGYWQSEHDFLTPVDHCLWNELHWGVFCSPNSKIYEIDLGHNYLYGTIPEELGFFSDLEYLILKNNVLYGPIPKSIYNLPLFSLQLQHNHLSGSIDSSIDRLQHLTRLNFGENAINGTLPETIWNIASLQYFNADNNYFTGHLPESAGINMLNCEYIDLSRNNFSGNIPQAFFSIPSLEGLYLEKNNFSGKLPDLNSSQTSLKQLYLYNNALTGAIPSSFGSHLPMLSILYLGNNSLTSSIPSTFRNLKYLKTLWIQYNNCMNGTIPEFIGNLVDIYFTGNCFYGQLPMSLLSSTSLVYIYVDQNKLSGRIPDVYLNESSLMELQLSKNSLVGTIPASIESHFGLEIIDFSNNRLTGSIPSTLRNLQLLNHLSFAYNNCMNGTIPDFIGTMTDLTFLNFAGNCFDGQISPSFANLKKLEYLFLRYNYLTGDINFLCGVHTIQSDCAGLLPEVHCTCCSLCCDSSDVCFEIIRTRKEILERIISSVSDESTLSNPSTPQYRALDWLVNDTYLRRELITPDDKNEAKTRYNLAVFYFSTGGGEDKWFEKYDFLTPTYHCSWADKSMSEQIVAIGVSCFSDGTIKALNLENNGLDGTIPNELGFFLDIQYLILRNNFLRGPIPQSIYDLTNLVRLDVKNNRLTGSIDSSVGKLQRLQTLYLHQNQFKSIPDTIWNISSMRYLYASQNDFTGHLPEIASISTNSLRSIFLGHNRFSGHIPNSFLSLPNLTDLDLSLNRLSGNIPEVYSSRLRSLNLMNNSLTGTIPPSLGSNLHELTNLFLYLNRLTGSIPSTFKNLKSLYLLAIGYNNCMNGTIPEFIGTLTNLTYLNLAANCFQGQLPQSFRNLTKLEYLYINENDLTGNIDFLCGVKTLWADCAGQPPEVFCECCGICCDDINGCNY